LIRWVWLERRALCLYWWTTSWAVVECSIPPDHHSSGTPRYAWLSKLEKCERWWDVQLHSHTFSLSIFHVNRRLPFYGSSSRREKLHELVKEKNCKSWKTCRKASGPISDFRDPNSSRFLVGVLGSANKFVEAVQN
jgi:hypothetical protein